MSNIFEDIIKKNAQEYYTTGKQELTDDEFDAVIDEVKNENPESEVLKTGWGYNPNAKEKVSHKYTHIGSLGKIKDIDDIKKDFSLTVNVSAKLDGMSVVLYYTNGELEQALTRGDGEYGIDITNKVLAINSKFGTIKSNFTGAIRGEIFMSPQAFEIYKNKHPEAKNHRNSAIGIINSDEITSDYQYLSLMVYTIVADESNYVVPSDTITSAYNILNSEFGKQNVVPNILCNLNSLDETRLLEIKEEFSKYVNLDGLVITDYSIPYHNTTYTYDYKQIAYKFQDEIKATTVTHLEWTMSKNGAYIPVVCIKPVELEGTTVKRVTGYNAQWVKDNNIIAGSVVFVRKSNQIIPQIVKVINN